MGLDVVTVHYNTPFMMECMIRSLNRHTQCNVHVFDNSDEAPFVNTFDNVEVIDNTRGQVIDFDKFLSSFPDKRPRVSNYGSAKHCKTVDLCFDMFQNGFILMDSDVLVREDISCFADKDMAFVGEIKEEAYEVKRVLPFLCYVNVPLLKDIRYFNGDWMWHLNNIFPNKWYDTGAWFYRACMEKGVPYREERVNKYIEHFFHGSHAFMNDTMEDWLEKNESLWRG